MNWGFPEISTCLSRFKSCLIWKMQLWSKPELVEIFKLSKFATAHIICWKRWFEIAVEGKFYHYQSSKHHQWDKTIQTFKNATLLFDNVPEMLIAWVIFLACFLITLLTSLFLQSLYSFTIEYNTLSQSNLLYNLVKFRSCRTIFWRDGGHQGGHVTQIHYHVHIDSTDHEFFR